MPKKISHWAYILPILFGIIGALIGYLYLREKSMEMAKHNLLIGIATSLLTPIGGLIVYLIFYRK